MNLKNTWRKIFNKHQQEKDVFKFLKFIGPGILVTVGFIDPGNWATNVAAGALYGNILLWVVALSTIMLIFLQHNAAHLGIATGLCLSESASINLKPWVSRIILSTAVLASIATAFAEIMGAAIALNMLFLIDLRVGALISTIGITVLVFTNSYKKIEKLIMMFVSIIGISFLFELSMIKVDWGSIIHGTTMPNMPNGSIFVVMSIIGSVVMPHNLFLHSEVIQSREWNLADKNTINKRLKYEFVDTIFSMVMGFMINCAMIILAASTFFVNGIKVTELGQSQMMLRPILGSVASVVFAVALLFAGISSAITAAISGGSIFAGIFKEPYNVKDAHSKIGVGLTLIIAVLLVFAISDPFHGLIISQMALSVQLPITVFLLISLTSSRKVMGEYANKGIGKLMLWMIATIISLLNIALFVSVFY